MAPRCFVIDPHNQLSDEEIHDTMGSHIGEGGLRLMNWTRETETPVRTDAADLETLAVLSGQFPSKAEARRKGLCGPIPHGVEAFGLKSGFVWFWVWNPKAPESEPTIAKGLIKTKGAFWFEWTLRKEGSVVEPEPIRFIFAGNRISEVQSDTGTP